jgi:hypothetical protein
LENVGISFLFRNGVGKYRHGATERSNGTDELKLVQIADNDHIIFALNVRQDGRQLRLTLVQTTIDGRIFLQVFKWLHCTHDRSAAPL